MNTMGPPKRRRDAGAPESGAREPESLVKVRYNGCTAIHQVAHREISDEQAMAITHHD
jgi:hypothetical protein